MEEKSEVVTSKLEFVADGQFRLEQMVGSGSYGEVYRAVDVNSGEEVAVKIESSNAKSQQLWEEFKTYSTLHGREGIPRVRYFGVKMEFNILVMDLLGPSLEELFNACSRRFTLKTVLMLADQMISRVEYVHSKNFVHRDLKPENFLMGKEGRRWNKVHLIDFGLAKRFRDPRSLKHMSYREDLSLVGTIRYASKYSHLGIELSRRDDMESLGYILLYFLRGSLPWQGLKAMTTKQKLEKIMEMKTSLRAEKICEDCPAEFQLFLNYCRRLRFDEAPDYNYLRQLLRVLFRTLNYEHDFAFDWKFLEKSKIKLSTD